MWNTSSFTHTYKTWFCVFDLERLIGKFSSVEREATTIIGTVCLCKVSTLNVHSFDNSMEFSSRVTKSFTSVLWFESFA